MLESKSTSMCDAIHTMNGEKCIFSSDVKHLLDSMLCVDHKGRYTIDDVQDSMRVYCKQYRKADSEHKKADERKACDVDDVEKKKRRIVY